VIVNMAPLNASLSFKILRRWLTRRTRRASSRRRGSWRWRAASAGSAPPRGPESGQIVERGSHTVLLAAGGRYADLYQSQFRDSPDGRSAA